MVGFKVDTKLFQELGELLVAKESTALVELIKNAYDADATHVSIHGENLDDPSKGAIVVKDDGIGMTEDEFARGFLTIAGRTKTSRDRRSPVFSRRYTGEKGIGRLAAHKLGTKFQVVSLRAGKAERGDAVLPPPVSAIQATINWNAIEKLETLDDVAASSAVVVRPLKLSSVDVSGTTLTLAPLRRAWVGRTKNDFLNEAATLSPLPALWEVLPEGMVVEPLLFDSLPIRDQKSADPGFTVSFSGDLSLSDRLIPDVATAANWVAEIEFNSETGILRLAVSPTARTARRNPTSEGFRFKKKLGVGAGPSFRSRIFQQSNKTWDRAVQGIRVFMEGFRVPPYGDPFDDWLELERTYKSRAHRQLTSLANLDVRNLPDGLPSEEIVVQGNAAYMGAVFLHRRNSDGLQMLVNREGFVPGPALEFVSQWVRVATDLIVRLGYASRVAGREVREEERATQTSAANRADVNETPTALRVRESAIRAEKSIDVIRDAIKEKDFSRAAAEAAAALPKLAEIRTMADDFGSQAVMWRVLASLGTELAAFVHEVNSLGLEVAALIADLDGVASAGSAADQRRSIQRAKRRALDLADRIKRNATYLVDSTSFEGRRRRSRLPLSKRLDSVVPFFKSRIEQKKIQLTTDIPATLRTPPMFPAELAGILTNLLSNAVKFTDEGGRIRVRAKESDQGLTITMENTGTAVDLRNASKWFDAYQSTTERPDAVLGQGMGMGLTIARAFVQEYGGEIAFVKPTGAFATAIQLVIPGR